MRGLLKLLALVLLGAAAASVLVGWPGSRPTRAEPDRADCKAADLVPLPASGVDVVTVSYMVHHVHQLAAEVKRLAAASAQLTTNAADLQVDAPHQGLVSRTAAIRAAPRCQAAARGQGPRLRFATLNLWNVSPPWPARRDAITAQIRARGLDIVAFQEVRFAGDPPSRGGRHQLAELAELLPELSHHAYLRVASMTPGHEEGLGVRLSSRLVMNLTGQSFPNGLPLRTCPSSPLPQLLSRFPVKVQAPIELVTGNDVNNRRRLLVADVDLGTSAPPLTVAVAHWSYADVEQCQSAVLTQRAFDALLADAPGDPWQIVMGDFNTYLDFPW